MRGPTSYDDGYISRKLSSLQTSPTFLPAAPSYGRSMGGGYLQPTLVYCYIPDYPPLPSRMTPRMVPPSYYDDYGYGGYGYGGGYGEYMPRQVGPRMSRYDAYVDDEYDGAPPVVVPRYNRATRLADAIVDAEKEKMLQDEMDKMRIRLKSLSYSLDPSGPVPEIVYPDRSRRANSLEATKRYTSAYSQPKSYYGSDTYRLSNTYTSKYPVRSITGASTSKWEEPDTIYSSMDKHPYSKSSTGDDDDKKERRKKKKSRERDLLASDTTSANALDSYSAIGSEPSADLGEDPEMDEKEKKRMEKKKRKAEREAAATAAMEAELAALAAAEAELAMLEAGDIKPEESATVISESEPAVEQVVEQAVETEPATEPEASQEK